MTREEYHKRHDENAQRLNVELENEQKVLEKWQRIKEWLEKGMKT